MYFERMIVGGWQQFGVVDISFHDRMTIITGANGSGKTTLLGLLARHFGWQVASLSTPKQEKLTGVMKFVVSLFRSAGSDNSPIGSIRYSNGAESSLWVPQSDAAQYHVSISNQQPVKCFFIPSHRAIFKYQPLASISTAKKTRQSAFHEVSELSKQRVLGSGGGQSPSFLMKNTLIGWAISGYGVTNGDKVVMPRDLELVEYFEGFQDVLRMMLPATLGFDGIEIRNMEVVFVCNGGADEFLLETASGGISALIDMAWQIYMFSTSENSDYTVIIDEIENHLHPVMQRTVLQNLLDAFPQARFVVTTHSPLVVGSVKNSHVYALRYGENKRVDSTRLDLQGEPKTAAEILDEVLGVSFTMPLWVETRLNEVIERYSSGVITAESMAALRRELAGLGLEKMFPYVLTGVAEAHND